MIPIDKVKSFPPSEFILFVGSKAIIGLGLGVLLGRCCLGAIAGCVILVLGIILSLPGWIKALKK